MRERSSPQIRVYIVEDQALIRETLSATLDLEQSIEVRGMAAEAEQALQELRTLDVDLVLMDIGLPGVDGITATRALKECRPDLPVVLCSGYGELAVIDKIGDDNAVSFLRKPFRQRELVDALRNVLGKAAASRT